MPTAFTASKFQRNTGKPIVKSSFFADTMKKIEVLKPAGMVLALTQAGIIPIAVGLLFYQVISTYVEPYAPLIAKVFSFCVIAVMIIAVLVVSAIGVILVLKFYRMHTAIPVDGKYHNIGGQLVLMDGSQSIIPAKAASLEPRQKEITGSLQNVQAAQKQSTPLVAQKLTKTEPLVLPPVQPVPMAAQIQLDDRDDEEEDVYPVANQATMYDQTDEEEEDQQEYKEQEDDNTFRIQLPGTEADNPKSPVLPRFPEPKRFSDYLATGWRPSTQDILFFNTLSHGDIYRPVEEAPHILLSGSTGSGKGNVTRLLCSQLLYAGVEVYMVDFQFQQIRLNRGTAEDWRPLLPHFKQQPGLVNPAVDLADIQQMLTWFNEKYKELRIKSQDPATQKVWKHRYLFLCEWPATVKRLGKDAEETIGFFLREIAKYNMHLIVESQGAQIGTLGGNMDLRENYKVRCLLDANADASRALFKKTYDMRGLGNKGTSLVGFNVNEVYRGRWPFYSNYDTYRLFAPDWKDKIDDHDMSRFEEEGETPKKKLFVPTPPPAKPVVAQPKLPEVPDIDQALNKRRGDAEFIPEMVSIPGINPVPKKLVDRIQVLVEVYGVKTRGELMGKLPTGWNGGDKYPIVAAICDYKKWLMDNKIDPQRTDRL